MGPVQAPPAGQAAGDQTRTVTLRAIYTLIYTLAFILAAPYWLIRGLFNRAYLKTLKARFIGPGRVLPKLDERPRVWVWALSLGEVLSARELVRKLDDSGAEVVVTATTLSGLATARTLWPTKTILPSPLDFNLSTRRFLDEAISIRRWAPRRSERRSTGLRQETGP